MTATNYGWLVKRMNDVEEALYWHTERGWVPRADASVFEKPSDLPPTWRIDDRWVWERLNERPFQ